MSNDSALLTSVPTEAAPPSALLVGGGKTINRPSSPPLYFNYVDTDLQQIVIWNGSIWVVASNGPLGPQGPQGGSGPQGPQGLPGTPGSGVVSWSSILNIPTTFDVKNVSLTPNGYIQMTDGFQLTWFTGTAQSTEGSYSENFPFNVGTALSVQTTPNMNQATWVNNGPNCFWCQVVTWSNSAVTWFLQNSRQSSGFPVTPSFLVISNNPGSP